MVIIVMTHTDASSWRAYVDAQGFSATRMVGPLSSTTLSCSIIMRPCIIADSNYPTHTQVKISHAPIPHKPHKIFISDYTIVCISFYIITYLASYVSSPWGYTFTSSPHSHAEWLNPIGGGFWRIQESRVDEETEGESSSASNQGGWPGWLCQATQCQQLWRVT